MKFRYMINKGLNFNNVILKIMKVHVRKNILMVKLVCVFKVAEYILNMKALGLVVSDKKIFESFILRPIY